MALVNSGIERNVVSDEAKPADFSSIPVISLAAITGTGVASPEAKATLVQEVKDAVTRVGFFYVKDHGISQDVIDRMFAESKAFFALPEKDKMEIHFKKSPTFRGYEPVGAYSSNTSSNAKPLENSERFNYAYDEEADPLYQNKSMQDKTNVPITSTQKSQNGMSELTNVWPSTAPSMRKGVMQYYGQILMLSRALIRVMALVLDLPETYFDQAVQRPGCNARVIHYPAQPIDEANLGIGAHSDIGGFTLLAQYGDVNCLQVLNCDGHWIEAPPIPGTLVVNIGDMLSRWTNDKFLSTMHRVTNRSGKERYSAPCFFGVSHDTLIDTLPTCLAPGEEKKYPPVIAGDYVYKRLARSRLGAPYDEVLRI